MKRAVRQLLDRRSFFRSVGAAAGAAAAVSLDSADARAAEAATLVQSNVKRASEPSALKITDLRVAVVVKAPMTCPIIRVDTNQGLVGLGRSARRRERDVRADAQEPAPGREPVQRRQDLPEDQAVRRARHGRAAACAESKWR